MNPNKALWEKGDFTRIAESMRESGEALGDDACARLRTLVRPLSKAVVESHAFTLTNRSAGPARIDTPTS